MTYQEKMEKFQEMVKDINVCMLVTKDKNDDGLRSRPMWVAGVDEDGTLWFFTNKNSGKTAEINDAHNVNVSFSSAKQNTFISVMGQAMITDNRAKVEEYWSVVNKAWFPEGKDSSELTLVKVTPEEIEWWNDSSSKLVEGFKIAKALITGERYKSDNNHTLAV